MEPLILTAHPADGLLNFIPEWGGVDFLAAPNESLVKHKVNLRKAEQMVLYFAHKSKRDAKYGMVKLAKMMFYSDFWAFQYLGESITGLEYRKLPQGPVPTRAKSIQSHLIAEGKAYERQGTFGRNQLIPTARFKRKDFEATFSPRELDIMDDVYEQIKPLRAGEISDLSHAFVGWQVADWEEVIPYATQLIQHRPLTQRELNYGAQLLKEMGTG